MRIRCMVLVSMCVLQWGCAKVLTQHPLGTEPVVLDQELVNGFWSPSTKNSQS